jgi:hypothetical protein
VVQAEHIFAGTKFWHCVPWTGRAQKNRSLRGGSCGFWRSLLRE